MAVKQQAFPLTDGTVYSKRKNFCPLTAPSLKEYLPLIGEEKTEKLLKAVEQVKDFRIVELNSSAKGGGVAEMLFSRIPFLNSLGLDVEWKIVRGTRDYYECTKGLHNLLQGKPGCFTPEMEETYFDTLEDASSMSLLENSPDIVMVHDPQPLGLMRYLKQPSATWFWRCHIDCEVSALDANPGLWEFMLDWVEHYDAAIFSAAHYIVSRWPLPKFIIPPSIDPLSEKNRILSKKEISKVLDKYSIDPKIPMIVQVGRFDPWKGIDLTINTYRKVRETMKCQLIIAGGLAADDPEGERIFERIEKNTQRDGDIHLLKLSLDDRLENFREVNALQRAANIVMQPSTKEGFGLVITEALWKQKPVVASSAGAIPLQIREGDTGLFYNGPGRTAKKIIYLLENPKEASAMGKRGHDYVKNHFLMPDRVTDNLSAMYLVHSSREEKMCPDCIVSFHPWYKLSKRGAAH